MHLEIRRECCAVILKKKKKRRFSKEKDSDLHLEDPPNSFTAVVPLTADGLFYMITIQKGDFEERVMTIYEVLVNNKQADVVYGIIYK